MGGAIGDALGAGIEFLTLDEIREQFGPDGVTDLVPAFGRIGAITDDTQMTLFTAEGLIRAQSRWAAKGICHWPTVVYHAYVRWLNTQGFGTESRFQPPYNGWLIGLPPLHARRAPGITCVNALSGPRFGTIEEPLNSSKGCGGVMRVAPVGLFVRDPFRCGCECAAITHGHPTGYLAAGAFSLIIARVAEGREIERAVAEAIETLREHSGHEETVAALDAALRAAEQQEPSAATVETLGRGWVAEEALAIAVYSALAAERDFVRGVLLAVNHSGDSDSTSAIAGNLLGAQLGEAAIPERWLDALELREEIVALADDLVTGFRDDDAWYARYPGG